MSDVYTRLDDADAIVVATPVYFPTVPALLQALYDRCQPYWSRRYVLHTEPPPRRPGALLLVGGGGDPYGHGCAVTTTKSVFAVLSLDYTAEVVVEADSPSDVKRRPDALARAGDVGAQLVAEVLGRRAQHS